MEKHHNEMAKTTLKDIARKTGYSVNTVSRALRDMSDISTATRHLIQDCAREMGYFSNSLASSLRLGYTSTIALIVPDASNPDYSIMTKGIEELARLQGYTTIIFNTNEDPMIEHASMEAALSRNVDGIVICPTQNSTRNVAFLQQTKVPFVLVGRHFNDIQTDYVVADDIQGGYLVGRYFLELGHEDVLILTTPPYISIGRERLQGFRAGYKKAGLTVKDSLIREVSPLSEEYKQVMDQVFRDKLSFSGIFCFNDILAWRVWRYLRDHGFRVPEDYSLIGFDNIQSKMVLPVEMDSVGVSRVHYNGKIMEILLKKMRGEIPFNKSAQYVLNVELVRKGTVQPFRMRNQRGTA